MRIEHIQKIILKAYAGQTCEITFTPVESEYITTSIEVVITDELLEKTFITVLEKDELLALRNSLNKYVAEIFETNLT